MNGNNSKLKSIITTAQQFVAEHRLISSGIALSLFCLIFVGIVIAQSGPSISTSFEPADPSRTWMDLGGVWDGANEVTNTTGDTFTITIRNTTGSIMTNVQPSVELPSGFHYVSNTAAGVPGITASQGGTTLTFSLSNNASINLNPNESVTIKYGLYAESSVPDGTVTLEAGVNYEDEDENHFSKSTFQNIVVQAGASIITKTPFVTNTEVNEEITWTVQIKNVGFGGLFDVSLIEEPGAGLEITSISVVSPNVPAAIEETENEKWMLPYLAPDEVFEVEVKGKAIACGDALNTVKTTDRTAKTNKSTFVNVELEHEPSVTVTPSTSSLTLDYNNPIAVEIDIKNTGNSAIQDFALKTNLHLLNVAVSNVANGWNYDAQTGKFTLAAAIGEGQTIPLTFDASVPDNEGAVCLTDIGGKVRWKPAYTDICNVEYDYPVAESTIHKPNDMPEISLEKSVNQSRFNIGDSGSYTLKLTATHPENLATDSSGNVIVTDTLPTEGLDNISINDSSAVDNNDGTITWTIPKSVLVSNNTATLDIGFNVSSDACFGGEIFTNEAEAQVTTKLGCLLSSQDEASILVANNPGVDVAQQFYNIDGSTFETGTNSGSNQGDLIPHTASYAFGNESGGTFTGSIYEDNYGGLASQKLVAGSLKVSVNSGSPQTVPTGSYSDDDGKLTINLDFMAQSTFANTNDIGGQEFEFTYDTTISDSDLGGNISRSAIQIGSLSINNGGDITGACGEAATFKSGDTFTIARANAIIDIDPIGDIEMCNEFEVTLRVSNANNFDAHDVLVTFFADGDYVYKGLADNNPYGGAFNTGNITVGSNGNSPTFQYIGNPLTAEGIIKLKAQLKDTADPNSPTPLQAQVDFNDRETASEFPRAFHNDVSTMPASVRAGKLSITSSPAKVLIRETVVQWTVTIRNIGSGTAFNSKVETSLASQLLPDEDETNAANSLTPPGAVTINGQDMSWSLGDIPSGNSIKIVIVADVNDFEESSFDGTEVTASWGCGGVTEGRVTTGMNPNYVIPGGAMQAVNDTSQSYFDICEPGVVLIKLRNTGMSHLYGVKLTQALDSGLNLVSGEYSIDRGASFDPIVGSPTVSGNKYTWDESNIGALEELGSDDTVWVKLKIESTFNVNSDPELPTIKVDAEATLPNGVRVTSVGAGVNLPAQRPDITVEKLGRNRTTNSTFSNTVYGGVGDEVEWQVKITNNGNKEAKSVRLKEIFPQSGTSGTIVGHGINESITDNEEIEIADIPKGDTHTYIITQELDEPCVDADNEVSVTWACPSKPDDRYESPSQNTDTAYLKMIPDLELTQDIETSGSSSIYDNGRVRVRATLTNNGGPATKLKYRLKVPEGNVTDSMTLDESKTAASAVFVLSDSNNHTADAGNGKKISVDSYDPITSGKEYELTFNSDGWIRHGESFQIEYYLIQTNSFDTEANGGTTVNGSTDLTDFKYPESTDNGLDPDLPKTANNDITVHYESTCGGENLLPVSSESADPRTPDLDISVNNFTQTVQKGQSYEFDFFYTIKNNGEVNSVASNIEFNLAYVGITWDSVSITGPNGETGTSSITLTNSINAGQSVIVKVHGKTNEVQSGYNLHLIGEVVGKTLGQDESTFYGNYSFDRAAPLISDDVDVSGYVYLDENVNGKRDPGEGGTGAAPWTSLWAKLVNDDGTVVDTQQVNSNTGEYVFEKVSDTGSPYNIVISDSATPTNTPMSMPAGYLGTEYPSLMRDNVVVGAINVFDQNFGLYHGSKLTGTVFKDTGAGTSANANNGILDGSEEGISGVNVKATSSDGSSIYSTAITDSNGQYTLSIPDSANGKDVRIVETNPPGYVSTGGNFDGDTGKYNLNTDTITFAFESGKSYVNIDFGDVPKSTLTNDGNKTLAPGGVVGFPHVFIAGTDGEVTFSTDHTANPDSFSWTHTVYLDANQNGVLDQGEVPITGSIPVQAGQEIYLVIRENAPANATTGAQDIIELTAELAYSNSSVIETLKRGDVATVNTQPELKLVKEVDKQDASSGEELTYTITYTNDSSDPISNLVIDDFVPAFTTFVSASAGTLPNNLTNVTVITPNVGEIGAIKWTFDGTLAPGEKGAIEFKVKVDE